MVKLGRSSQHSVHIKKSLHGPLFSVNTIGDVDNRVPHYEIQKYDSGIQNLPRLSF